MKKEILKLAGVKSEKEFYKLFPTEESFRITYGKELDKLVRGSKVKKADGGISVNPDGTLTQKPLSLMPTNYPTAVPDNTASQQSGGGINLQGFGKKLGGAGVVGKIAGGVKKLIDEKKQLKRARQWQDVSEVSLDASRSKDVDINRQMADMTSKRRDAMMPVNTGEEFFPIYGVGTNVLAKDGALLNKVGGNLGEIQNTYNPGTMYDDLGYEPLSDSTKLKSFKNGGEIPEAGLGSQLSGFMTGGGSNQATGLVASAFGNSGGAQLGEAVGDVVGMIPGVGPLAGAIAKPVLTAVGGLLDTNAKSLKKTQKATERNVNQMALASSIQGVQQQNASYMKDGGWISNDWTPQLITKFGEHKLSDLLKDDPTMDTLRTGGHIRENSGLPDFAMGGDLKTHWGGYAEPVSQNPFLPEGGETVMFRGQSHDDTDGRGRTGIGVTYGNSPVEVERGEPAVKLQDGGGLDSDLVVFGNLKIPNQFASMLNDPNAKGKKFKNYVADLSNVENRQNKLIDQSSSEIDDLNVNSSFDKLKMSSYEANIMGANMTLKEIAQKKQNAAALQQAINDTAREHQLDADELAKGNVKQAKYGKMLKAEDGYTSKYGVTPWEGNVSGKGKATASSFTAKEWDQILDNLGYTGPKGNKAVQEFLMNDPRTKDIVKRRHQELYKRDPFVDEKLGYGWASEDLKRDNTRPTEMKRREGQMVTSPLATPEGLMPITPYEAPDQTTPEKSYLMNDILNEIAPYVRKSNKEALDPRQLAGEMFALSQNKLEPVRAQMFQPQLTVPYDISLQDVLNENQAAFRSAQRTMGYNPAAQANLAAQQYQANQKVLGEQFRMNQAEKNQVYAQNRQLLDQAQLQNLGTLDQQYQRQEAAKSTTKATTQAALNSISDKYMKNQLDNRTLQTYENMYNFRFGPDMVAQNWNAPARFNIPDVTGVHNNPQGTIAGPDGQTLYPQWKNGKFMGYSPSDKATTQEKVRTTKTKSRNGSIVSDLKNFNQFS